MCCLSPFRLVQGSGLILLHKSRHAVDAHRTQGVLGASLSSADIPLQVPCGISLSTARPGFIPQPGEAPFPGFLLLWDYFSGQMLGDRIHSDGLLPTRWPGDGCAPLGTG